MATPATSLTVSATRVLPAHLPGCRPAVAADFPDWVEAVFESLRLRSLRSRSLISLALIWRSLIRRSLIP